MISLYEKTKSDLILRMSDPKQRKSAISMSKTNEYSINVSIRIIKTNHN